MGGVGWGGVVGGGVDSGSRRRESSLGTNKEHPSRSGLVLCYDTVW